VRGKDREDEHAEHGEEEHEEDFLLGNAPNAPHVPGRLLLPPGRAGLRRRLTPLAAGCFALGACPYVMYCPARLALASFASDAPDALVAESA